MNIWISLLVPGIFLGVAAYGLYKGVDVFAALVAGAGDGLKIMLRILPTLVAMLTAITMLRASGALELATNALTPLFIRVGIPPECAPLVLMRPISGSGALAVGSELMTRYGCDSLVGRTAAVMLGSTETTFYTLGVYGGAAGISRTRYALAAALLADATGFWASSLAVRLFMA